MPTRKIRIQETNEIASLFNTVHECESDNLPEWFKPLQNIVEDSGFTNMTITLHSVHYLIMPATSDEIEAPEPLEATSATDITTHGLDAVETALMLLYGNITNLRTEMLVMKSHLSQIAENTGTIIEERDLRYKPEHGE